MTLSLKRMMVGTALGRVASGIRKIVEILHTPRVALGTIVNDQLAVTLMARLCREGETFVSAPTSDLRLLRLNHVIQKHSFGWWMSAIMTSLNQRSPVASKGDFDGS